MRTTCIHFNCFNKSELGNGILIESLVLYVQQNIYNFTSWFLLFFLLFSLSLFFQLFFLPLSSSFSYTPFLPYCTPNFYTTFTLLNNIEYKRRLFVKINVVCCVVCCVDSGFSLWRRANARNVRLYYPYWQ